MMSTLKSFSFFSIMGSCHPVPVHRVHLSSHRHFNMSYKCTVSDPPLEEEQELAEVTARLPDPVASDFSVKNCSYNMWGEMWQGTETWRGCCPHYPQVSGGTWFVWVALFHSKLGNFQEKVAWLQQFQCSSAKMDILLPSLSKKKVNLEPRNSGQKAFSVKSL